MKYYKLLFIYLILSSCDVSLLSDADSKNINKLKVNITIQDGTTSNTLDQVKVHLTDGKKQIINEGIKILMNGKPLELFVQQDLYYTKTSFYRDTSLIRSNSYYFEIMLSDSTVHPIAYLKPLKKSENAEIIVRQKAPRNEDLSLQWKNINMPSKLEVWKLMHLKKDPNMHSGGRYAETTMIDTLSSKSGKKIIPKSFFEDSLEVADYIKIRLDNQQEGLVNPQLLKNSTIIYNYIIEETVAIEE